MTSRDHREKINEHIYAKGLAKKKINVNQMSFDLFFFFKARLSVCDLQNAFRTLAAADGSNTQKIHFPSTFCVEPGLENFSGKNTLCSHTCYNLDFSSFLDNT